MEEQTPVPGSSNLLTLAVARLAAETNKQFSSPFNGSVASPTVTDEQSENDITQIEPIGSMSRQWALGNGSDKLGVRLILRLINETFLSLPLKECRKAVIGLGGHDRGGSDATNNWRLSRLTGTNSRLGRPIAPIDPEHSGANNRAYDICNVDWTSSSLIQGGTHGSSGKLAPANEGSFHRQTGELLLRRLFEFGGSIRNSISQESVISEREFEFASQDIQHMNGIKSDNLTKLMANNASDHANLYSTEHHQTWNTDSQHQFHLHDQGNMYLTQIAYLSVSSILSVAAICVNLFILLIVFMSSRQSRNNGAIRSNPTSQHNMLLTQLTLTGILIACLLLADNAQSNNVYQASCDTKASEANQLKQFQSRNTLSKSLQSFLPPIRFSLDSDSNQFHYADNSNLRATSGLTIELNKHGARLSDAKSTVDQRSNSNKPNMFLELIQEQIPRLIDMSFEIISVEPSKCRHLNGIKSDYGNAHISTNSSTTGSNPTTLFASENIVPLLMSVLASVHVWTLAALAYDRYCAIAYPLQYLRCTQASRTKTFYVIIWIASTVLNLVVPMSLNNFGSISVQTSTRDALHVIPDDKVLHAKFMKHNEGGNGGDTKNNSYLATTSSGENLIGQLSTGNINAIIDSLRLNHVDDVEELVAVDHDDDQPNRPEGHQEARPFARSRPEKLIYKDSQGDRGGSYDNMVPETLAVVLIKLSSRLQRDSRDHELSESLAAYHERIFKGLYIVYRLLNFVVVMFAPLLIVTICNISIYRIVKVHERRLSFNSSSNAAGLGTNWSNKLSDSAKFDNISGDGQECNSPSWPFLSKATRGCSKRASIARSDDIQSLEQDMSRERLLIQRRSLDGDASLGRISCTIPLTNASPGSDMSSQPEVGSSNMVNRSKRLLTRQDSYQILARIARQEAMISHERVELGANQMIDRNMNEIRELNSKLTGTTTSVSFDPKLASKTKRKISDHSVGFSSLRRNSNISGHFEDRSLVDHNSQHDVTFSCEHNHGIYDTKNIMDQLKMAGLSFAGIAIHELVHPAGHRPLNKSTSWSLGNLYSTHTINSNIANNYHISQSHNTHNHNNIYSNLTTTANNNGQNNFNNYRPNQWATQHANNSVCESRCSVASSSATTNSPRRSYVSLGAQTMVGSGLQRLIGGETGKCVTRILDPEWEHQNHSSIISSSSRLVQSLGTKSITFNSLIWLVLSMLIMTTANYLVTTSSEYQVFVSSLEFDANPINPGEVGHYLSMLIRVIYERNHAMQIQKDHDHPMDEMSTQSDRDFVKTPKQSPPHHLSNIWLPIVCRILFLIMIPLNGWLYGIRFRSLKATIRIILKRYISRKQAFIEINQRQKSMTSLRSRNSSASNLLSSPGGYQSQTGAIPTDFAPLRRSLRRYSSCRLSDDRRESLASTNTLLASQTPQERCVLLESNNNNNNMANSNDPNRACSRSDVSDVTPSHNNHLPPEGLVATNQIRFHIGDYASGTDAQEGATLNVIPSEFSSIGTSLDSFRVGSSRSLISASIHSSQSAAYLLLDHRATETAGVSSSSPLAVNGNKGCAIKTNAQPTMVHRKLSVEGSVDLGRRMTNSEERRLDSTPSIDDGYMSNQSMSQIESANMRSVSRFRMSGRPYANQTGRSSFSVSTGCCDNRQSSCIIGRRCSMGSDVTTTTTDNKISGQPGKASSEVRLCITPADYIERKDLVNDTMANRHTGRALGRCSMENNIVVTPKLSTSGNDQSIELDDGWLAQLKQSLIRILPKVTSIYGDAHSLADKPRRPCPRSRSLHESKGTLGVDGADQAFESYLSLLDSRCDTSIRTKMSVERNAASDIGMKHSLTMSELDGSKSATRLIRICECKSCGSSQLESKHGYSDINGQIGNSDQASSHLKPPSFLKLVFDPSDNQVAYSNLSALSPIKECSSNHSCASSQTSLSTITQAIRIAAHLKKRSSKGETDDFEGR